MSPYERLESAYARRNLPEPFLYHVRKYMTLGFVFSRPDFFVAARPVRRDAPPALILDDDFRFRSEDCDCWFIFAASGNMSRMHQVTPWALPWYAWTRMDDPLSDIRFVDAERLMRLCPPDLSCLPATESPKSPSALQPPMHPPDTIISIFARG